MYITAQFHTEGSREALGSKNPILNNALYTYKIFQIL